MGEPLYLDVVTAIGEAMPPASPVQAVPEHRRRPLRPRLQGIHPGHGQGRLRRTCRRPSRRITSPSASTTTSRTPASTSIPLLHRGSQDRTRAVLRPRFGRHRRRQQELHQDHRRGHRQLRAGLLRLRLEEGRHDHHLAPALRPEADPLHLPDRRRDFVACHQFSFLERSTCCKAARPGRHLPALLALRPGEVWDQLPARRAAADHRQEAQVLRRSTPTRWPKSSGMGGRINTIMQTCFFAICGILPREEAIAAIKEAIKKTYGKRGEAVVEKNFAAVDVALAEHLRGQGSGQGDQHVRDAARRSRRSARVRAGRARPDHRRLRRRSAGERLPAGRHLPDRHLAVREAQHRRRNPGLGRAALHPVRQVRPGLPARRHPREGLRAQPCWPARPTTFKSTAARWREFKGLKYTLQVAPEDCTGCGVCVEVCPAKSKTEVKHKAINMEPQPPFASSERANWDFFLATCPDMDRKVLKLAPR